MTDTASRHLLPPTGLLEQALGYDTGSAETAFPGEGRGGGSTRRDGYASQLLMRAAAAAVTLPRGVPSDVHQSWTVGEEIDDNGVGRDNVVRDGE